MENKFIFAESEGGFDNHILNSIPGYDAFLKETVTISHHWINDDSLPVIDIGGSTGKLLDAVQRSTDVCVKNKFFNVEPTEFDTKVKNDYIVHINDVGQHYIETIHDPVQLFFSIFTLQFLGSANRTKILKDVSSKLGDDGAFIVAEKFFIEDSEYQELFSVVLRQLKRSHFSSDEILEKDVALLKHLKLKTEKSFIEEMNDHNFKVVKYWQSLHFNAFICTKIKGKQ